MSAVSDAAEHFVRDRGWIVVPLRTREKAPVYSDWQNMTIGLADVPISTNNKSAGVTPMPENVFMGTVVVDKNNVEYFLHKK